MNLSYELSIWEILLRCFLAILFGGIVGYERGVKNQAAGIRTYLLPNHSYLSQLDVTYKTPDLMSHFLPPHEVSFTFCCSSIVFPR